MRWFLRRSFSGPGNKKPSRPFEKPSRRDGESSWFKGEKNPVFSCWGPVHVLKPLKSKVCVRRGPSVSGSPCVVERSSLSATEQPTGPERHPPKHSPTIFADNWTGRKSVRKRRKGSFRGLRSRQALLLPRPQQEDPWSGEPTSPSSPLLFPCGCADERRLR